MCFSASASFGAGAVLAVVGVVSVKQVRDPSQLAFASLPVLFSIQQITEGVLWISLPDPAASVTQHNATYLFLFFAQVVWPALVPISILLLQKESRNKTILKIFAGIGVSISAFLIYLLLTFHVEAKIEGQHIFYFQDYPRALRIPGAALYVLATIAPLFFSQVKRMWVLGSLIAVSYLLTEIFYTHYVLSVWCFFAAVISIVVLVLMRNVRRDSVNA
ncbi:MAG TPA: DUF6629 family protein [Cyclobacteriaceae bacterium]|nr:DUF6629 family protein [Cyclobacteriaceae bacterium]